jgi:(2Fe-2S) ferredoxin
MTGLFKHHIFVCLNEREPGNPRGCCKDKGAEQVLETFRTELLSRGLKGTVRANKAGCLDQCALGVAVVIYPSGTWYVGVKPGDVKEILDSLMAGKPVSRLLHPKQNPTRS